MNVILLLTASNLFQPPSPNLVAKINDSSTVENCPIFTGDWVGSCEIGGEHNVERSLKIIQKSCNLYENRFSGTY